MKPQLTKHNFPSSCQRWFATSTFVLLFHLLYTVTAVGQQVSKDFLTGRFNYTRDTTFIRVPSALSSKTTYLKKEAFLAFQKMHQAALKQGIRLVIISGTRSFDDQKAIWERKWNTAQFAGIRNEAQRSIKILNWSSMPGTSRHHWGTDMDLNSMNLVFYKTTAGKKLYDWLCLNAPKYGFQQPFCAGRSSGYREEKWHWSYVPLSKGYLRAYQEMISNAAIDGFKGANTAAEIDILTNWVSGVNPHCKNVQIPQFFAWTFFPE